MKQSVHLHLQVYSELCHIKFYAKIVNGFFKKFHLKYSDIQICNKSAHFSNFLKAIEIIFRIFFFLMEVSSNA